MRDEDRDEIEVPEGHKLIEFDIDMTNPRDIRLHVICREYDLDGEDIIDALAFALAKLKGPGSLN